MNDMLSLSFNDSVQVNETMFTCDCANCDCDCKDCRDCGDNCDCIRDNRC